MNGTGMDRQTILNSKYDTAEFEKQLFDIVKILKNCLFKKKTKSSSV